MGRSRAAEIHDLQFSAAGRRDPVPSRLSGAAPDRHADVGTGDHDENDRAAHANRAFGKRRDYLGRIRTRKLYADLANTGLFLSISLQRIGSGWRIKWEISGKNRNPSLLYASAHCGCRPTEFPLISVSS